MDMMEIRKNVLEASPHIETETGDYEGNYPAPLRSLKVGLESIQDLNGYDAPWPAGGGKNKFDYDSAVDGYLSADGKSINSPDAGNMTSDFIPVTEGQSYIYQCYPNETGNLSAWTGFAFYASKDMSSVISSRAVFPTNMVRYTAPTGANYVRIGSRYLNGGRASFEEGSTVSPWTPYSNICPISGHSEVSVVRTGKNMLDTDAVYGEYKQQDGTYRLTGTEARNALIGFPKELIGKQVTCSIYVNLSKEASPTRVFIRVSIDGTNYDGNAISSGSKGLTSATFTPTSESNTIRLLYGSSGGNYFEIDYAQLELGSTATSYEPYNGITVTVPFGDTVYGGTLDVVKGEFVVDRYEHTFDGNETSLVLDSASNVVRFTGKPARGSTIALARGVYSHGVYDQSSTSFMPDNALGVRTTGYCYIKNKNCTTLQDFKDWFVAQATAGTPVQISYLLATPLTISLIPQQISSLIGQNHFTIDGGTLSEIELWRH